MDDTTSTGTSGIPLGTADAGGTAATTHGTGGDSDTGGLTLVGTTDASNAATGSGGPLPAYAEPAGGPVPDQSAGEVPSIEQLAQMRGELDTLAQKHAELASHCSMLADQSDLQALAARMSSAEEKLAELEATAPTDPAQLQQKHWTALEHICQQLGL